MFFILVARDARQNMNNRMSSTHYKNEVIFATAKILDECASRVMHIMCIINIKSSFFIIETKKKTNKTNNHCVIKQWYSKSLYLSFSRSPQNIDHQSSFTIFCCPKKKMTERDREMKNSCVACAVFMFAAISYFLRKQMKKRAATHNSNSTDVLAVKRKNDD